MPLSPPSPAQLLRPALFLDRDGVIIENRPNYVQSWNEVSIFPQALPALRLAAASSWLIVLVTNQSGIGRGVFPLAAAEEINARLVRVIAEAGGRVDGVFMCPHAPEDNCTCRKPQPGLLLQAAAALPVALPQSVLIGDAVTDLQAGWAAGVREAALVRTGRGAAQAARPESASLPPFRVFDHLLQAVTTLLDEN